MNQLSTVYQGEDIAMIPLYTESELFSDSDQKAFIDP